MLLSHLGAVDIDCVLAFRVTEIIEFALNFSEKMKPTADAMNKSATAFSFTGLFGGAHRSTHTPNVGSNGSDSQSVTLDSTRIISVTNALLPLKLKFAMSMADFGLIKEAAEYAVMLKKLTSMLTAFKRLC